MDPKYDNLPLKANHDIMWAAHRYIGIFDYPESGDQIPFTTIPGPNNENLVPFMIEAPLSSVEIFEAILKPSKPFKIYTGPHVPLPCQTKFPCLAKRRRMYAEYRQFQGRLEKDREISYICVPRDAIDTVRRAVGGWFWLVELAYISIPWTWHPSGRVEVFHPHALVLNRKPSPGTVHTSENRLAQFLREFDMVGCDFRRSLLRPGTTPLPECLWDWFAGIPGSTVALPYYATEPEEEDDDSYSEASSETLRDSEDVNQDSVD